MVQTKAAYKSCKNRVRYLMYLQAAADAVKTAERVRGGGIVKMGGEGGVKTTPTKQNAAGVKGRVEGWLKGGMRDVAMKRHPRGVGGIGGTGHALV